MSYLIPCCLIILARLSILTQALSIPSGYAPAHIDCPSSPIVRAASELSSLEAAYISARKASAGSSLATWLKRTNSNFSTTSLPTIALTTSGGGYRSLLTGAGIIQGLDDRDSNVGTSGIFQSLTYQAGLSGGAWLLSSFAGNNYPTISSLKSGLWETAFQDSLLVPENLLTATAYLAVINDIKAKNDAGFPPTLTDIYGRLLSYQLLNGFDGGVNDRLSGVASLSNFTSHRVPYPIITSLGVQETQGQCLPGGNGTQYEFHPYEFGSWDVGVAAFVQTPYLGSLPGACVVNFDDLGYVLGTSSSLFNEACLADPSGTNSSSLPAVFTTILEKAHSVTFRDEFAVYPNPFYQRQMSTLVSSQQSLYLADGGESNQNDPIWPFLQTARQADVLVINDNSADTSNNFPNGSEILTTYQRAQAVGLTRMPYIPAVEVFVSQKLNQRPTFFGCFSNDTNKLLIIYVPNVNYTFPSNQPTSKLQYSKEETDGMIANGVQIINKGGDPAWPTCLGCAFVKKSGNTLPAQCASCFTTYCYN